MWEQNFCRKLIINGYFWKPSVKPRLFQSSTTTLRAVELSKRRGEDTRFYSPTCEVTFLVKTHFGKTQPRNLVTSPLFFLNGNRLSLRPIQRLRQHHRTRESMLSLQSFILTCDFKCKSNLKLFSKEIIEFLCKKIHSKASLTRFIHSNWEDCSISAINLQLSLENQ